MRRGRGRRQRHESTQADEQWEQRQPDRAEATPGLVLDLMKMLETLDEEDRALLILKYAESYDYAELAEIFDLSVSASRPRNQSSPRETATSLSRTKPRRWPKVMADNFLERLGELEVPPPPAEFDAQLHERVNESLLGVQLRN